MNIKKNNNNYNNKVRQTILFIFFLSLTIVVSLNVIFFSTTQYKFNTEMFLNLLPFNLIGLSTTLYLVLVLFYNLGKMIMKPDKLN